MNLTLPHTIENDLGEKLTFKEIVNEPDGEKLIVEAVCKPGSGPTMHVHYLQDEAITVVSGKLKYQILGQEPVNLFPGQTAVFLRNQAHRFWNDGDEDLHLEGWVKPPNTIVFFLSSLYAAQKKSGSHRPEPFDGAYLITRYKNEYDLPELPVFVKKFIMPATYQVGKLLGKYKKFEGAPKPL